jgi:hypothetical protein
MKMQPSPFLPVLHGDYACELVSNDCPAALRTAFRESLHEAERARRRGAVELNAYECSQPWLSTVGASRPSLHPGSVDAVVHAIPPTAEPSTRCTPGKDAVRSSAFRTASLLRLAGTSHSAARRVQARRRAMPSARWI